MSADVVISEENFPDEVFRGWILGQEYGGRSIDAPQKGINIIRHTDGTTRKVLTR